VKSVDLAIIGAGPAGMTAALEAAKNNVKTLIIDEQMWGGGQLVKQTHKFFGSKFCFAGTRGIDIARKLIKNIEEQEIELWLNAKCIGLTNIKEVEVIKDGTAEKVIAKTVILATGAAELPVAFPGWDLPGVMGAGAAQTIMNLHRVLPGKNVLMVGAGNVGLIVSYQLLQAGVKVLAIVEATSQIGGYGVHAAKIRRMGVPILTSTIIKAAEGENEVETAVIAKVDHKGKIIVGTEEKIKVDAICIAVGLRPLTELAWMAGCNFSYAPKRGGYVPILNDWMESSVKGIYVAGDLAGVEEATIAMEEGRLCGTSVAKDLGYLNEGIAIKSRQNIMERLGTLRNKEKISEKLIKVENINNKMAQSKEDNLASKGYLSMQELTESPSFPSKERLQKGPVAVIECTQAIPCNPCEKACPVGAIFVGKSLMHPPILNEELCIGCGQCISACPGLAIFSVDMTFNDSNALIGLPYEFLPLPEPGSIVKGTDRAGKYVCQAHVISVKNHVSYNHTPVVYISVPKKHAQNVRSFIL